MCIRDRFLNFVNIFSLFCNYLPLKKGLSLHLNKFESPSPKNALCKVWLKLERWFWSRRFLNFINVFSVFRNYLPLENGAALHLNQSEFTSPKDTFCWVWLTLAQWFWRRWYFLNSSMYLRYFMIISPLPKDCLCQVWLKLAQWFWRRRWKFEKFTTTTTTTTTTDNGQILMRKAHLSPRFWWANEKKLYKH